MALTTYLISNASDHLGEKQIQLWITLFKKLPKYNEYAFVYSETVLSRLQAAEGTVKARMLNALMKEIDSLGVGEVQIKGDDEGTYWSQSLERISLIEEAFDVIFDDITTLIVPIGTTPNGNIYGSGGFAVATGNRSITVNCPICNYYIIHRNGYRYCGCLT